jgi:hypothetical protein
VDAQSALDRDCGLTNDVRDAIRTLDAGDLQQLHHAALTELACALVGGADTDHLRRVAQVVVRIAARLQADD